MDKSECVLVEKAAQTLFHRCGKELVARSRDVLTFDIRDELGGGRFATEGKLRYMLDGSSEIGVKMDILLQSSAGRAVGIECKFLSSVTDQFKSRAYDMIHLKKEYGGRLYGIMLYVHVRGHGGLGLARARAYCHPYDKFLGYEISGIEELSTLELSELCSIVEAELLPEATSDHVC